MISMLVIPGPTTLPTSTLEFTNGVIQIQHAAFVSSEEFGHAGLKTEIDSSVYDLDASDSWSNHTTSLNDALLALATMDHASLLVLGNLDMARCDNFVLWRMWVRSLMTS